jgi:NADH-quinone oxidoreductase subunit G
MPEVTIDGRKVEIAPGTNVIEAARKLGIEVPYYCYHPALTPVGSCRMCQVEILEPGKPPRVTIACRTEATQGLNVSTTGKDCVAARAFTLEFLLANHPLDCPICDKAGECDLQDFTYRHGNGAGRFTEPKRPGHKHELIGDHILLDQERCILCTRCVRFMGEYAKSPSLVVAGRGDRNVIATFPGEPIRSNYEGNLADICPVGALTLKEFRFKSRVWDLDVHESVCTLCDRNCTILLETKRNQLLRARPLPNLQVNGHFMCDVGRFGLLEHCNPEGRELDGFAGGARKSGAIAADELAAQLAADRGRWIVVLSARLGCEELLVARAALAPVARILAYVPAKAEGGDAILYTGRRAANQKALELLGIAAASEEDLAKAITEPATAGLLCFDSATAQALVARAKPKKLALVDVARQPSGTTPPAPSAAAPLGADFFVPGTLFSEKAGTFLNVGSVLQRANRAQRRPQGVVPEVDFLRAVALKAGVALDPLFQKPDLTWALLESLGLPGMTLMQLPSDGMKLVESAPAAAAAGEGRRA